MDFHWLDVAIVIVYVVAILLAGIVLSRRAARNMDSYFLGGRNIPWYLLSISNASGQFDVTGTMAMVAWMFIYGMKSCWLPWQWPTFNQVFLMIFLAAWLRRSGVLTGAEWLRTRFRSRAGLELSHLSIVLFAMIAVIGFLAYAFVGVGKFAEAILPWDFTPNQYALILMAITTIYVVAGGMYSVVLTDIIQFVLLTIASVCVAWIAMGRTTAAAIAEATPAGWNQIGFGWHVGLDWNGMIDPLQDKIGTDGYGLFGIFVMMALLKGILASIAGPAPNYDMQRILAARSPREASLMSGLVSPVLYVPRYLLISGITVLAIVYFSAELQSQARPDFEQILPFVIGHFIPPVLKGILLAGLLAGFMSTFDSTVNAGAAYLVNDVYKKYLRPDLGPRHYVLVSYCCSLLVVAVGIYFGHHIRSIDQALQWITAGLYGGYIAPNLLKWVWWRLNGIGYFAGMVTGIALAMPLADIERVRGWIDSASMSLGNEPATLARYVTPLNLFPLVFLASVLVCVAASLCTRPESDETLMQFYRQVRPWGCWGPVRKRILAADPAFQIRSNCSTDLLNCGVGIVWQIGLTAAPMFLVIQNYPSFWIAVAVVIVTSVILKMNWYDRLEPV